MTTATAADDKKYPCFKCLATGQLPYEFTPGSNVCPLCEGSGFIGDPLWRILPTGDVHGFYLFGDKQFAEAACTFSAPVGVLREPPSEEFANARKCHTCMVYVGQMMTAARERDHDRYQM